MSSCRCQKNRRINFIWRFCGCFAAIGSTACTTVTIGTTADNIIVERHFGALVVSVKDTPRSYVAEVSGVGTLGYSGRNVAVMPLFAPNSAGGFTALDSQSGAADPAQEAFSVLGQFSVSSATTEPNIALERFFSTGLAAQILSRGFQGKIAEEVKLSSPAPDPSH